MATKKTTSKTKKTTSAPKKAVPAKKTVSAKKSVAAKKTVSKSVASKAPVKKGVSKSVPKKATPQKSKKAVMPQVSKAPQKASTTKVDFAPTIKKKEASVSNFSLWLVIFFLIALIVGILTADSWVVSRFKGGEESMVVVGDQTWLPVPGKPMTLMVLNDKSCGAVCDATQGVATLRQNISPALMVEEIDLASAEGVKLKELFEVVSVPQFIFGPEIADFQAEDGTSFLANLPAGIFTAQEDYYHLNGSAIGLKPGKYIEVPSFDLTGEPVLGNGPVQVIEFTDYQCPFCQRLHNNNKDLIARLVEEGKISYVVKDFPLPFHTDAPTVHQAANCVLQEGGNEAYFTLNEAIFANLSVWSGQGTDFAADFMQQLASNQGLDIAACMENTAEDLAAEIEADMEEGRKYGVTGTPALFIGSQIMPGAIGPDVFAEAVEAELR